ncbi:VOC family protein [Ramlibacter sp. AW1]|uniref:VOC family protein n=1 Tax=Ramlibacter aurantiacus TaxID=2801330 RepID=A0A937D2E1_9BURK|nr:VOC family protein [Ramlibacter aurantiacus]MBL0421519.1 VOC family protein [Ramlibacter aurantiacus]
MTIKELGYIVLDSPDLARWGTYLQEVVGAMVSEGPDGSLRVRIDERDCRLLLRDSPQEKLAAMGWLVRDEAGLRQALETARAEGCEPRIGTADECIARRVNGFFAITDPAGHSHEIAWGPVVNFRQPFRSPAGVPAFMTGDQGLGHLVIGCEPAQFEATSRFTTGVLGLQVANLRAQSLSGEPVPFPITWFHADNPRQHSLGLAASFTPGAPRHGCRHINLEVPEIDDVGRALDRCDRHGVRIARSLGRHVNDRAISFYMASPGGFLVEYGCAAPRKDWSLEIVYDEGGAGSVWGHKPNPAR